MPLNASCGFHAPHVVPIRPAPNRAVRRDTGLGYNAVMSLESISRVVSNALKAAAVANSGTPDEKGAVDVLAGLAALLESRIQLHKHASLVPMSAPAVGAVKPKPLGGTSSREEPAASAPDDKKRRTANESGDSYDLK